MFGTWWMEIMGANNCTQEDLKKMQKEMTPFYLLQLLLTLFMTFSLASLAPYIPAFSTYHIAFWIWVGFLIPASVSSIIWGNTKKKYWVRQIFILTVSQLLCLMIAAYIL
jgi:hypothetical protein